MKALVYTQPKELVLQDLSAPELHDDEVVLEIEAVGICGSDMHAWHGHDPRRKPGLVLGLSELIFASSFSEAACELSPPLSLGIPNHYG